MKYFYKLLGLMVIGVALTGIGTNSWGFYYQPDVPDAFKTKKPSSLIT